MKTTLGTLAILTALAAPLAVSAQDQDEPGSGHMMQEGEMGKMGGMHGMMQGDMEGMMSQMAPMMEACTEMVAAMSEHMENTDHHSGASEQSEG